MREKHLEGILPKVFSGVRGLSLETCTLFQANICDSSPPHQKRAWLEVCQLNVDAEKKIPGKQNTQ